MRVFLAWILLFGSVLGSASKSDSVSDTLIITNVNIVDTRGGEILRHKVVVIKNGRIDAIASVGMIALSQHLQVVNASGKYLIPGLWDMHVHSAGGSGVPWDDKVILPLYIANGITGIRDMGGDLAILKRRRDSIEAGALLGPHMIIAGPFLDGGKAQDYMIPVNTPAEARAAVDKVRSEGVDFVKILSRVPREAYFAIADEAKKQKIPFAGHVPESIDAGEASAAGQRSIEHVADVMMACSRESNQLRKQRMEARQRRDGEAYHAAGMRALETYDPRKAQALFAEFRKNGTWQVPTLVWWRTQANLDSASATDPRLQYVPSALRKEWDPAKMREHMRAELVSDLKKATARYIELTRSLHEAKVPMLAGTDSADPYDFPGFSLHEEMELLVQAGFAPFEALRAATYNPAVFAHALDRYGVVEEERVADLVLLEANPLDNIHNTSRIAGVVRAGKFYRREDLDRMLQEAAKAAAAE
jgi:imidazolonepropionase-like amidohydrolase